MVIPKGVFGPPKIKEVTMKKQFHASAFTTLIAVIIVFGLAAPAIVSASGGFTDFGQVFGSGYVGGLAIGTDGKIYGTTGWTATNHLFVFDPSNSSIIDKGIPPIGQNWTQGITLGPDGKIYGGAGCQNAYLWVYDPATGSFANKGQATPGEQCLGSLVTGNNGRIYGGTSDNSATGLPGYLFEYDPATDTFSGRWAMPDRHGASSLTVGPDGKIYVGTFHNGLPFDSGRFFVYDPTNGTLVDKGSPLSGEDGIVSLVTSNDGKIYGGTRQNGHLFSYDPSSGLFSDKGQAVAGQWSVTSLTAFENKIYGGTLSNAHLFEYDIATQAFTDLGTPVQGESKIGTLVATPEGVIYGGTGWHGHFFTYAPYQSDIGFRPNPDGYSFPNYGGVNFDDYTTADMRQMFGDDCVCRMVGPVCFVKWHAIRWNIQANRSMNDGHCDGMASTSLRFFKGLDTPSDLQGGANTTHDLELSNVRRHIAYYFVEQWTDPVKAYKEQVRRNTLSAILDQLRSAMLSGAPDPTTLFVRQAGQGGHALTPYAIEDRGNGVYWVRVYDNNHPDDANRYVVINTTNDTWSYDLGWTTWNGDANPHALGIVPISEYAKQPVCPEWRAAADELAVWLSGEGHLLITDSQGQRIGYVGDQFVNEVPGAYESIVDGGLGVEMEPIYTLPLSDTYTILLDGQTLTQAETVGVTQFGPGYATWVDDVTLGPTSQDQLTIAPDGTQLAYQSSGDNEATLALALDGASESSQLQVNGADIGTWQVVTLTADVGNGQLVFNNAQTSGGEYDLEISRINATGEQTFVHAGLVVSATDTHYADYGAWDGSGPMTLYVDHGSDGTMDETLQLDNQAGGIYLPIITKNYR
jgi:hypothetical protein